MKAFVLRIAAAVLLGSLSLSAFASTKADVIRAAIYRGPASCEDCSETLKRAIEKLGPNYRVDFIGEDEPADITAENLSRYDIYAQPGGDQDIAAALKSLGDDRIEAIHDYVAHGGGFLGICMGAYLASGSGLGLVSYELYSEVGRPGFPIKTIDDAAITMRWEGCKENVFYQDGPYMLRSAKDPGFRAIATYENGDIAAARYSLGKGVVTLSGPHPEADEAWFEEAGIPLSYMPSSRLLRSLLDALDR